MLRALPYTSRTQGNLPAGRITKKLKKFTTKKYINMKLNIRTLLITLLLAIHVLVQSVPLVLADETQPTDETASTVSEQTTQDEVPVEQQQEQSQEPTQTSVQEPTPTPTPYVEDETDRAARLYREQLQREIQDQVDAYLISQGITPPERNRVEPTPETANASFDLGNGSSTTPGGVGDVEIDTGDATNATSVTNAGNNNLAGSAVSGPGGSGATVANTANGTGSDNNGSAVIDNTNNTNQNNSATVNTDLNSSTVTGDNTASDNVGDASIETGDANTTGTVLTMVNTNAEGIMVSEFNIVDDQIGDVVLDFAANCIIGCGGPTEVSNTGNGSNSTNDASTDTTNTTNTTQENDAQIGNDLVLTADTGSNTTSSNTGGDSSITTGDANVAANVMTFANNNIAGNVIYGIVNIFGDLIGDIIFPESQLTICCGSSVTAQNTGNGSSSDNSANINVIDTDNTFQSNTADITNDLTFDANTGDNSASRNTGGDSTINTGDTNVDVNLLNIANSNLSGGNWWIVLVNDITLGWVGKIMGAPDGAMFAGSEGSDFAVDENGFITATNNKNGTNSTNDASASTTNTNTTNQTNNADINNNLNLTANTGNNSANDNTGGNSNIKTGDATIVANLVNFVNNNISGNGKIFVTVVNVFGSWLGDFISPGQKKEAQTEQAVGAGSASNNSQNTSNNNNTGTNNSSQATTQSQDTTQGAHAGAIAQAVVAVQSVFGAATGNAGNGNNGVTLGNSGKKIASATLFQGESFASDKNDTKVKNAVRINLAWILLLLPVLLIGFTGKKFIVNRLLPKK